MTIKEKAPYMVAIAVLALLFVWYLSGAFASDSVPEKALQELGYTSVEVGDKSIAFTLSGCTKLDIVQWSVSAIDATGNKVNFTVCDGAFTAPSVVITR